MTKDEQRLARIFYPNTRFERMARRSGGISREIALKQAQEQIDACQGNFTEWLNQQLQDIQSAAVELTHSPSNETARARLERICSDIRDIGTTMGCDLLSFAARSLCSVLDAFREGAGHATPLLDCHGKVLLLARAPRYRYLRQTKPPR